MEIPISNRSNIVINADDFGLSHRANRNILFLASLGKIDRVSVMVDGEISEKEIKQLIQSGVKIDIHLNLPFQEHNTKTCSTKKRLFIFCLQILSRKITSKKTLEIWEKQIEKFRQLFGKNPDGINSHEHIHFYPPFFSIALSLQQKFFIPYIRFGSKENSAYGITIGKILFILRHINKKRFKKSPVVSSNYLVSLDWIKDPDLFFRQLKEGQIEVVSHPELAEEFVLLKKEF